MSDINCRPLLKRTHPLFRALSKDTIDAIERVMIKEITFWAKKRQQTEEDKREMARMASNLGKLNWALYDIRKSMWDHRYFLNNIIKEVEKK